MKGASRSNLAFVAVTVIALILLAIPGRNWLDNRHEDSSRDAAISTAGDQVLDLTTLDSATVNEKLAAMGHRVTGDFKRQFDGFSKTFAGVVKQEKVSATGAIKSSAIVKYSASSAEVLIASSATVTSAKQTAPTQRDYRMKVSLDKIGGKWLVSGMEFVK